MDGVTENDLIVLFPYVLAATLVGIAVVKPPKRLVIGLRRLNSENERVGWPFMLAMIVAFSVFALSAIHDQDGRSILFGSLASVWAVRLVSLWRQRLQRPEI